MNSSSLGPDFAVPTRARVALGLLGLWGIGVGATAPDLDLDADGTVDFRQDMEQLNVPPLDVGVVSTFMAERTLQSDNAVTAFGLDTGAWVDETEGWTSQIVSTGRFGLRFRSGNNTHYGWLELHNPIVLGRPMLNAGGVIKQIYFNPAPAQPYQVGDTTLRAQVHADPKAGTVTLRFNTDAGAFDSALKIESRPAEGLGNWSVVATVSAGSSVTLPMAGDARLYRVVQ